MEEEKRDSLTDDALNEEKTKVVESDIERYWKSQERTKLTSEYVKQLERKKNKKENYMACSKLFNRSSPVAGVLWFGSH